MAYLTREERQKLLDDIKDLPFNRIKGKLRRLDKKGVMAVWRNAQTTGKLMTRFDLHGLGTVVTLIEQEIETPNRTDAPGSVALRQKSDLELREVIVSPMPENRL